MLSGCTLLAQFVGVTGPAVQIAAIADRGKLAVDAISTVGTGKSTTDHLISKAVGKDCDVAKLLKDGSYCNEDQQ